MAINPTPAALSIGTLVNGRFRVKKLLGYGGYGNVYLVEDELVFPGNQFALKESLSSTISERRQFTREAKWLMALEHPNLPRVAEQFEWNSRPYFVMAYVAGENLEDRVDRLGPLPEDQVLAWLLPICDAAAYLHEQKRPIIHRDIKPGNIIVSKDGRPWLVDFGIAKQVHSGVSRKTTRAARAVSGGYSPLEQYTRGGTDVRSDIYALGATFYHLLTGICPPEAPDIASGVARLPDARQVHGRISRQSEQVVMRAMSQKPEDRYQSVRALMADLPGGRTFRITANGTVAQPVAVASNSKRNAKGAKGAAAPAQPVAAASQATAVGAPAPLAPPASFTPAQMPTSYPPGATFIGPQPASALPYGQPTWVAPQPAVAAASPPAQPVQRAANDTQEFLLQPQPPALLNAPGQAPVRHRRVVLPGIVALVSGLAVLTTMLLTGLYLIGYQQYAPASIQGYGDVVAKHDLRLNALLTLIPIAALLLMVLPIANWLKHLGRGWTYLLLLLVPLAGLAPVIVWIATGQAGAVDSIVGRGFFVPVLFFLVTWVISLVWFIRRR